jgi:hypothetical protein
VSGRWGFFVAVGIALAAVVAGCGDSDDSASGSNQTKTVSVTTSSLSKAEFIKRANAACGRAEATLVPKLERFALEHQSERTSPRVKQAKAAKAVLIPVAEAQIDAIRKLGAPKGDEAQIETILTAQQRGIDELKEVKRIEPGTFAQDYFIEGVKKFKTYKLVDCGLP